MQLIEQISAFGLETTAETTTGISESDYGNEIGCTKKEPRCMRFRTNN